MDSEMDTSPEGHQNIENRSQKPSTTAISTIVLNSKPIQLVVAILQVSLKQIIFYSLIPVLFQIKWRVNNVTTYNIKYNSIITHVQFCLFIAQESKL